MKRLSILASLLLVAALLLTMSPVGTSRTKAAGTLKFWTFEYGKDVQPFFEDYVKEWNSSHEVQVEWRQFPFAQYTTEVLTTGIATGDAPDVFFISPGDWRRYAEGNLALPLELPDYLKADLLPAAVDAVTYKGKVMSVPFEMEPVALWYNKAILKEAGVEVPTTWDELLAAAKKIKTDKRYGILIPMTPDYYENFIFYPFLWSAGGSVVDKDFTKSTVNSAEAARALDLWGQLVKDGLAPSSASANGDPVDDRFGKGEAGMMVSGYWLYGWAKANAPDLVKDLGVAPIPAPDKNTKPVTVYGGWTVMVYANTPMPKEASEFAINMFGAKDNKRAADWAIKYNTKLSPRMSVAKDNAAFYKDFPYSVFANDIFAIARPEPSFPPEIAKTVNETLQDVMFKGISGKDAAAAWAAKIDTYLKTRK